MIEFSSNIEMVAAATDRFETLCGYSLEDRMSFIMDLSAADGCNGNLPIDWDRLIEADDFNFMHDIGGIHHHLDRSTGKLEGGFLPRFAVQKPLN